MNYKNLSSTRKDALIEYLALHIARTGPDCSALMYYNNEDAINRVIELYEDKLKTRIDLTKY